MEDTAQEVVFRGADHGQVDAHGALLVAQLRQAMRYYLLFRSKNQANYKRFRHAGNGSALWCKA